MIWPNTTQERLLRQALAVPASPRGLDDLDVETLDPASRRLLPLVYPTLGDGPLRDEAEAAYRRTALRNRALFAHGRRLVEELARAGVRPLALKGAALVAGYYRDPGLRPMADLDLAVPPATLFPTLAAFRRAGWSPRYVLTRAFVRTRHAAPFATADGFACDLHWRIVPEPTPPAIEAAMWAAARETDVGGANVLALSPADQLLHVCLHGARWAPEPAVWWVGDAAAIVRAGEVDWSRLVAHAVAARFVLRLREALGYLHDRLSVAVPAGVLDTLRAHPVSGIERVEWRRLAREHRLLGELPAYWSHHRRSAEGAGLRGVLRFPAYLKDAWGVKSAADLPRAALARALCRLGQAAGRAIPR